MKLRVYVEVDASKSLCETIQRNGFHLSPDGSGMKLSIPNTPTVPRRKTKVRFLSNPSDKLDEAVASSEGK
jgi:hypothetical protein